MSRSPFIVLEHGLLTALKSTGKSHIAATAIVQSPPVERWLRSLASKAGGPEVLEVLERARSLLATAEGQFSGEFQRRVRACTADARAAIARAAE